MIDNKIVKGDFKVTGENEIDIQMVINGWVDTSDMGSTDTFVIREPIDGKYSLVAIINNERTFKSVIKEYNAIELIDKLSLENYIGDSPLKGFRTYRTRASIEYIKGNK